VAAALEILRCRCAGSQSLAFILAHDHQMTMGQAESFLNLSITSYCPDASFSVRAAARGLTEPVAAIALPDFGGAAA
jgi:hypothetical protein